MSASRGRGVQLHHTRAEVAARAASGDPGSHPGPWQWLWLGSAAAAWEQLESERQACFSPAKCALGVI